MSVLHRHDLVWLDAGFPESELRVTAAHGGDLRNWLARGLPLVVGRQFGGAGGVRLGFTLPGIGHRRRVEVHAPRAAIVSHEPPPALYTVAGAAPEPWRTRLLAVAGAFREAGLVARAYGSLVTQALTGEACLRAASDVDLLLDCHSADEALAALELLRTFGDGPPRLDGELRMPHGWAVAWRELENALASGDSVLAKADDEVRLIGVEAFLDKLTDGGTAHDTPRFTGPAALRAL